MSSTNIQIAATTTQTVTILGARLDRASMSEIMARLDGFVQEATPHHGVTVNLQFISEARKDPSFASILNNADLAVADGKPLLWISRILGAPIASRITGHDLLEECAALSQRKGYSMFLLGGSEGSAAQAVSKLRETYPGLRVEGSEHGKFSRSGEPERKDELVRMVREFRPDFLMVALGCPKQEFFIRRYMHELNVPVCIGIGGTLDVFTGRLKRAPRWMQRAGLEWVYRLQQEPKRLWKRYILGDLPTTLRALASALMTRVSRR
ncbi:MAG: WecB/TagA/CpsF family glycosyltransferase [Chloroflexi bacterium]|nr:WecB/TagA/CpsF family glycosyltransferase [Chloroflexota bacterium]